MGCGRAREEERPYRERRVREGGGEDRAYQRAANGAAMKLFAATPGREEWGRRLAREPGEEDRVPVRLLGGTLQGGGCRRSRTQGGGEGRECEFLVSQDYWAEPHAASCARRVIIERLMPRSSRSRVVRAFSSRTVWR